MPDKNSLGYQNTFFETGPKWELPYSYVADTSVHVSIDYHDFTTFDKQRKSVLYYACNIPNKGEHRRANKPSNSNFKEETEELQIENQIADEPLICKSTVDTYCRYTFWKEVNKRRKVVALGSGEEI